MRYLIVLAVLSLLPFYLNAQYVEEWQVDQSFYEKGILYFDYNHDGQTEITKILGNTVTVFDGSTGIYTIYWSIVDNINEYLTIWEIYEIEPGLERALFISSNYTADTTFQLKLYEIQGAAPVWTSPLAHGTMSFADAKNLDEDQTLEIVYGSYEYVTAEQNYRSRFVIRNGMTGTQEYASEEFTGYLIGPYLGDIDNDDTVEILINLYDFSDQSSTLRVYSIQPGNGLMSESLQPRDIHLQQNYPNPFNPSTSIPVVLSKRTALKVTVYNLLGEEIARLMQGSVEPGRYEYHWDGRTFAGKPVAAGMYFYEIEADGHKIRKPMVLVK